MSSFKGVLADLPTPIIPKIDEGGRHGNFALMMTAKEYRSKTELAFVPPHNPSNYPQSMGSTQEQELRN